MKLKIVSSSVCNSTKYSHITFCPRVANLTHDNIFLLLPFVPFALATCDHKHDWISLSEYSHYMLRPLGSNMSLCPPPHMHASSCLGGLFHSGLAEHARPSLPRYALPSRTASASRHHESYPPSLMPIHCIILTYRPNMSVSIHSRSRGSKSHTEYNMIARDYLLCELHSAPC